MGRAKGSGLMGLARSVRLPLNLEAWFKKTLERKPEASASEVLVGLIHGGLRLRDGYMAIHRRVLEHYITSGQTDFYRLYLRCLLDTFGPQYVEHLEQWLEAEGVILSPVIKTAL